MTTHKAWRRALMDARGIDFWMIDATVAAARADAEIPPERITQTEAALERSHKLFVDATGKAADSAEFQLAMEAGQVAFACAQQLEDLLALRHGTMRDRSTQRQREGAGFTSGEKREQQRAPEWDRWQSKANAIYKANPRKSNTAICAEVGAAFGVTGRAVAKRVQIDRVKK